MFHLFLLSPSIHLLYMEQMQTTKTQEFIRTNCVTSSPTSIVLFSLLTQEKKMETSSKISMHNRCNSFPSAPHPLVSQFQGHLQRLKDSEASTTSLSSSSISRKLIGLQDLHDYADKLLQLPSTQKALVQECSGSLLEGSLRLLDICNMAQDFLMQTKENLHEIQSVIRRKGADTGFAVEGGKYLASRKNMKKAIKKALNNLKAMKTESCVSFSNMDNETFSLLSILKEAETVTLNSLESLLRFISASKGQSKHSRWSIVSKLMQPTRVNNDLEECDINEFVKVDAALHQKPLSTENFLSDAENMKICIKDLEVQVECLSRKLIRTRVSLLNIFSY
ncbi:hypothetical protein PIB30_021784 [Stylosanthes scabra]|uniref:DUF241 domain protein n=1 Tax=Stylosanthes scabra TaxID=79078 RepID=A0ABU6V793_9FABA|nr:hypothetical protein [Stylosanthes scabra]